MNKYFDDLCDAFKHHDNFQVDHHPEKPYYVHEHNIIKFDVQKNEYEITHFEIRQVFHTQYSTRYEISSTGHFGFLVDLDDMKNGIDDEDWQVEYIKKTISALAIIVGDDNIGIY